MKQLKILTILIGLTASSGCTQYINGHVPLSLPHNCIFEKFTQEEKDYLGSAPAGDKIGRKIYRNQNACVQRQVRINELLKTHNEESKED